MMVDVTDGVSATRTWTVAAHPLITVRRPAGIMGIINTTPDSFSDGGTLLDPGAAAAAGARMVDEGASWLDVGGESSRPGAIPIDDGEEMRRVVPAIRALRAQGITVPISIDTCKVTVARAALDAGATAVNDISAGADAAMFPLVAERRCPVILMHMQGRPATMQSAPRYQDAVAEVADYLAGRLEAAIRAGVAEQAVLLDPGIGFGKRTGHNLALLRALGALEARLGRPLVVGVSRKSFLGELMAAQAGGRAPLPAARDAASHVLHGLLAGSCALLRVHDVAGAATAVHLAAALRAAPDGGWHAG
jgi:dihydropteroate synthase